jgi:cytidylate kinase
VVVAIDGPAAAGKSYTAAQVAARLGFRHLDSGSLYRAITAARLRKGKPGERSGWSEASVLDAALLCDLAPSETTFVPTIEGVEVDAEVRSDVVTKHVSSVAQMPGVRAFVNARLREIAAGHDAVVDGRDIGTAVFPDAALKIQLFADPWERARRRLIQRSGRQPGDDEIAAETERLVQRDAHDALQSVPARDAIPVDTTHLSREEQVERIVALARAVLASG